jgi:hypothetical protein
MLVLYETAMGYCLFKLSDSAKLESADLYKNFETPEKATKLYVQDVRLLDITQPGLMHKVEVESASPLYVHCKCSRRSDCCPGG